MEVVVDVSGPVRSDEELVKDASKGDTQAFRQLYGRYVGRVRGLIYQMTAQPDYIDDLTQEVFVKVFRSLSGFRAEARFSTWLFRIAVNCCQDARRQAGRRGPTGPLDKTLAAESEETLVRLNREQLVAQALQVLTPEHRMVVILHDLQDRTQEEIATVLKLPVGTIKSRLFYARRRLREWFQNQGINL